jgi:glycine/D-amino acid oxidase-like deaminating enzyme
MGPPDLTIRGAGVFGLAIAFAAARRGARVAVADPAGIGAGASGGVVGALAPHAPGDWNAAKAFQLEALLMAPDWWAAVEAASGLSAGYARTGRVQPLADAAAVAAAERRGAEAVRLWPERARWEVAAAGSGWGPVSATGLVIRDRLSARLDPRRALAALAGAVRAMGGTLGPEAAAGGPVVWATGAAGLAALGLGAGQKGQAARLGYAAPEGAAQIYAGGIHIVPHADGTVAVGSTSERVWDDPTATDAALDAVIARARAVCPVLEAAPVIERWAGLRPRAASRQPVLGAWPGRPGEFVANGGFKTGFGLAPLVGERMAALVLDGTADIPADFRPYPAPPVAK